MQGGKEHIHCTGAVLICDLEWLQLIKRVRKTVKKPFVEKLRPHESLSVCCPTLGVVRATSLYACRWEDGLDGSKHTATGRKFLNVLHYCRGLKKKGFQKDSTSLEKLSKYTVLHPFVTFQKNACLYLLLSFTFSNIH